MVLEELDWYMQKNETRPSYTICQNKLKMGKIQSYDIINILEENIGRKISGILCSNIFVAISPRAREIK